MQHYQKMAVISQHKYFGPLIDKPDKLTFPDDTTQKYT
jgi:hypothetical protein